MNDVPILVCACGKRLRAPGAIPGRVGRCPACGDTLRVPDVEINPTPPPISTLSRKKKKKRRLNETAIWDGLVKAPARLEESIAESLLYPLWSATGVASLVVLPPLLWITSMPAMSVIEALWSGGSTPAFGLLFFLSPVVLVFIGVFGYTLMFLGRVAASSAVGEVHPPRWPEWELSALFHGLGRWAWAGFVGFALGGFPATVYWVYCGDVDPFDMMILAELAAVGAVYALMALLASILHEDAMAANPWTVFVAIRRSGWGYASPCLFTGFAVTLAATVVATAFKVGEHSPRSAAFLFLVFWVMVVYEAMVVLRVLGLFYHHRAETLGWFRGRTGWGV